MSVKQKKPWSFGIFGGKKGGLSIVLLIVFILVGAVIYVGLAVRDELKLRNARPVLAMKSMLRDVREFIKQEKRFPKTLTEIESKVWNRGIDAPLKSRLTTENFYEFSNYEYVFFSGEVKSQNVIFVWAIPKGQFKDEAETVLVMITTDGEEIWKGPALTAEQREFVLKGGFNPTFAKMSEINMKKESSTIGVKQNTEKKGVNFFNN